MGFVVGGVWGRGDLWEALYWKERVLINIT